MNSDLKFCDMLDMHIICVQTFFFRFFVNIFNGHSKSGAPGAPIRSFHTIRSHNPIPPFSSLSSLSFSSSLRVLPGPPARSYLVSSGAAARGKSLCEAGPVQNSLGLVVRCTSRVSSLSYMVTGDMSSPFPRRSAALVFWCGAKLVVVMLSIESPRWRRGGIDRSAPTFFNKCPCLCFCNLQVASLLLASLDGERGGEGWLVDVGCGGGHHGVAGSWSVMRRS